MKEKDVIKWLEMAANGFATNENEWRKRFIQIGKEEGWVNKSALEKARDNVEWFDNRIDTVASFEEDRKRNQTFAYYEQAIKELQDD